MCTICEDNSVNVIMRCCKQHICCICRACVDHCPFCRTLICDRDQWLTSTSYLSKIQSYYNCDSMYTLALITTYTRFRYLKSYLRAMRSNTIRNFIECRHNMLSLIITTAQNLHDNLLRYDLCVSRKTQLTIKTRILSVESEITTDLCKLNMA
jgi:hypothetical protein